IHIVGRRGPDKTKFSANELEEFAELGDCDSLADFGDGSVEISAAPTGDGRGDAAFALLRGFSNRSATKRRRCVFRFGLSPVAISGQGRVERALFGRLEGANLS